MTLEPHTQSWKPMTLPKLAKVAPVANVFHSGARTARRPPPTTRAARTCCQLATLNTAGRNNATGRVCMPHAASAAPPKSWPGSNVFRAPRVLRSFCSGGFALRPPCRPSAPLRHSPLLPRRVVRLFSRVVSCRALYARWVADLLRSAVCFGSACCSRRRPDRAGRCAEHPAWPAPHVCEVRWQPLVVAVIRRSTEG